MTPDPETIYQSFLRDVPYADHPIVAWAVEEFCSVCGARATHKVEEESGPPQLHPLTAYLCCTCFRTVMGWCR